MCALKVLEETTVKPGLQFAIGSGWKLGCGMTALRLLQQISSSGVPERFVSPKPVGDFDVCYCWRAARVNVVYWLRWECCYYHTQCCSETQ